VSVCCKDRDEPFYHIKVGLAEQLLASQEGICTIELVQAYLMESTAKVPGDSYRTKPI
jgi:hypothetical protein